MASRRMVSNKVIDSAKFIKMPISSQCLYFHLIAKGDDDGVVEAFNVMRMIGATEDDLKVLMAKGFVVVLNEDLVTYITDWQEHNWIRADRKVDSRYKDLLLQIVPDIKLLEKKQTYYSKKKEMSDICQTNVSIGKDSIGKDNIDIYIGEKSQKIGEEVIIEEEKETKETIKKFIKPTVEEIREYCNERKNNIDAEYFYDFYESKGWYVGKNKMKNWKACVRTWEKDDKNNQSSKKTKRYL